MRQKMIETLLRLGFIVNPEDVDNPGLLSTTVEKGCLKIVEDLLKYGAKVNMLIDTLDFRGLTPLHSAVKGKQVHMAELLINYGANVNAKDILGKTPIIDAIKNRDTKMIELLLTNGADIKEYPNVLCTAAENGSLKIVEDLLKDGADVNMLHSSRFGKSITPLHNAVMWNQVEMAKLLIKYGANVNVKDSEGTTPIVDAVENRNTEMTELLLTNGADVKEDPKLLCTAVENGNLKIVEDILMNGADLNILLNGSSRFGKNLLPLHSAAMQNQVEIAKLLIKYGANVNVKASGPTPILLAISECHIRMTELLLINGADIKDYRILVTALSSRNLRIVDVVLKYGANVNMLYKSGGELTTALHSAVKKKQVEMAKLLINYGANVNIKDSEEKTPIVYAINKGDTEMFELLLTNGADIKQDLKLLHNAVRSGSLKIIEDLLKNVTDVNMMYRLRFGESLLHSAVKRDQVKVAKLLIKYGANVNVINSVRTTPIHYAILNNNTKMTELLLINGADIKDYRILVIAMNSRNLRIVDVILKYGANVNMLYKSIMVELTTALHSAVEQKQVEMAKLLINYGANVNIKNSEGKTPIVYAIQNKDTEMTELLLINGAGIRVHSSLRHVNCPITQVLKRHIVKMKAAGSYVCARNLAWISRDYKINNFLNKCDAEVQIMKSEKIGNSCASFYDILTKNTSEVAKNESIVKILKSDDYKRKFPIYASIIDSRFRRGLGREELLEQVRNKFLRSLFESLPELPLLCTEKIFSYLSDKDLRILLVCL